MVSSCNLQPASAPCARYIAARGVAAMEACLPQHAVADPTLIKQPQCAFESLVESIKVAAEQGNTDLVADRCNRLLQLCSLYNPRQSRHAVPGLTGNANVKKKGGVAYRPEYLLHSVLLADRLNLLMHWQTCLSF